jgi:hypothetical protein
MAGGGTSEMGATLALRNVAAVWSSSDAEPSVEGRGARIQIFKKTCNSNIAGAKLYICYVVHSYLSCGVRMKLIYSSVL